MLFALLACHAPDAVPRPTRSPARAERVAHALTVDCKGGGHYQNLGDAIAAAQTGDHITVAPCTYYGSIDFGGKGLVIESSGGFAETTLRPTPGEAAVVAEHGEPPGTLLSGFTIEGGGGTLVPAIDVEFSALTLRDVVITGAQGTNVVYGRSPHLVLERVSIEDSTATDGHIIRSRRGSIVLKDSEIMCGAAPTGYRLEHGSAFVEGSTFHCPGVNAIEVFHAPGRIQRVDLDGQLYVENEGTGSEGTTVEGSILRTGATVNTSDLVLINTLSLGTLVATSGTLTVYGSIVTGAYCAIDSAASTVSVLYSDFWDNNFDACREAPDPAADATNVALDPLFVGAGDYHLAETSPLRDAGIPDAAYLDPDGSPNDVGAYGGPFSLDGGR